jgi:hypothetical protein
MFAALPLHFLNIDVAQIMKEGPRPDEWPGVLAVGLVIFAVACALLLRLRTRNPRAESNRRLGLLVTLGFLLWCLAPLTISVVPRYQKGSSLLGVAYGTTYVAYHGMGLLLAVLAYGIVGWRRLPRVVSTGLVLLTAAVIGAIAGTTYFANGRAIQVYANARVPQDRIETALRAGLVRDVPEGAALILDPPYDHFHSGQSQLFYYLHTRKSFLPLWRPPETWPALPLETGAAHPVYLVRDRGVGASLKAGCVFLCKIEAAAGDARKTDCRGTRQVTICWYDPEGGSGGPRKDFRLIVNTFPAAGQSTPVGTLAFGPGEMSEISRGKDWVMYHYEPPTGLINAGSLHLIPPPTGAAK